MTMPRSRSPESAISDEPELITDVERVPDAVAHVIAELRERVQTLEARTQQCEAERDELAAACREARDAQRHAEELMRAREEILAVVAHDLRNPLGTIVMGSTALLQVGTSTEPKSQWTRTIAERMHRQAERMAQQINNLADFAEILAGRFTIQRAPQVPVTILTAVRDLLGAIARERGITLDVHPADGLPEIACDSDRVVRVLSNLIMNAINVTARGGVIESGARLGDHQQLVFFVRDQGPGIDRDEQATLFQPLWRSKHPGYRGTWLGFSIARGIVDAHGGRIWADSTPGAGTTVYFSLQPEN
ncbi:MAG TPA: HAMP domain-containing sensor histidine kinase [Kofleriaceae bacterium]|jgi:signal transduction histidine kinase|nr:HAMP domain-containing sensor histidine kinase [Kofleriaceae bacterium]